MKFYKTSGYYLILLFLTLIGTWAIPALVKKATVEPEHYPFIYYSSILKELCIIDYKSKEVPMKAISSGTVYGKEEADSLLPLLNHRQLLSNGTLPDSIDHHEITVQKIRAGNVIFRFTPEEIGSPHTGLYIMYESMPKRAGFESPGDVFRLKNDIQFIDVLSNQVNAAKSKEFQDALLKEGFVFPAQWSSGNMNPRKPYDEGYFTLDNRGELYHIKMVNGRPFVRNTHIGEKTNIVHFSMLEVADKRFYGFLFDHAGKVYIVEGDAGKYQLLPLEIEPLNLKKDQLSLMGNMLYWTVSVTTEKGKDYFGLEQESLKRLAEYHVEKSPDKWEKVSSVLFPFYLTFEDGNSKYIRPYWHYTGYIACILNIILAILAFFLPRRTGKEKVLVSVWTLFFGIPGILAAILLKK